MITKTGNSPSLLLKQDFIKAFKMVAVVSAAHIVVLMMWFRLMGHSKHDAIPLIGCFYLLAFAFLAFNNLPDFLTLAEKEESHDYFVRHNNALTQLAVTLFTIFILEWGFLISLIFIF